MKLIFGVLLVVTHNIWTANWTIVITLVAWYGLFIGIMNAIFPQQVKNLYTKSLANKNAYTISASVTTILGLFFAYHGFI